MTSSVLISLFSLFGNLFSYIRSPVLETWFSYLSFVYFFFLYSNFRKIYSPLFSNSFIEFLWVCIHSCPTLCNAIDCSPPAFSVHGISQARILEWVAISFVRRSSRPRDRTWVSCIDRCILYHWTTWEAPLLALGNCQSIFCLRRIACSGYFLHVESYNIWSFISGFFHLA